MPCRISGKSPALARPAKSVLCLLNQSSKPKDRIPCTEMLFLINMKNFNELDDTQNAVNIVKTIRNHVLLFLTTIVAPSVILFIEYKSGFFQPTSPNSNKTEDFAYATIILLTFIGFIIFFSGALKTIYQPYQYLREHFSLFSLISLLFLLLLIVEIILFQIMPWYLPKIFISYFKGIIFTAPVLQVGDYVSIITFNILIIILVNFLHQKWNGLVSVNSYKKKQSGQNVSLLIEGISEFVRIINRKPPLKIYQPNTANFSVKTLSGAKDSLSWSEQAQELVKLSSTSYYFDKETGWHDKEGCWIGHNLNNSDELIFLKPIDKSPSKRTLQDFVAYAKKISTKENKLIGEMIIATKIPLPRRFQADDTIRINYVSEDQLLNSLVDFTSYYAEIKRRFTSTRLPDSELSLIDVYTSSSCIVEKQVEFTSVEDFLNDWLLESSQRQIALLGEYGQGKSTASLAWAYHLITSSDKPNRVPIIIELRGTSPRDLTELQLLGAWASQYNINPKALMRLIIAGRIVLIFEGFDEMALIGNTDMRLKHFNTLWAFAFDKSKILITGRPNFFLDEKEMKLALGIEKPRGNHPFCEAVMLRPFTPTQISTALRSFDISVRDQIASLSTTNSRFLELVSRPSLLHIVASLWIRERLFEKVDKLTSAYIMDLFIRYSYRRQGAKQDDLQGYLGLTSLEREYFMMGIATYMAVNRLPNQIDNHQLNEIITRFVEYIPDSVSTSSNSIIGETKRPLKERIGDMEHGIELIKTDVRACGLLVADPAAPGTFRFGHKSFMEYLFAQVIAESLDEEKSEKSLSILSVVDKGINSAFKNPESIGFLSELLFEQVYNNLTTSEKRGIEVATLLFYKIIKTKYFSMKFLGVPLLIQMKMRSKSKLLQLLLNMLLSMGLMITGMISIIGTIRSEQFIIFPYILIFLGFLMYMGSFLMILYSIRFNLWLQVCREINIQEQDMKAALGISKIPWLNKSIMDIDLEIEDKSNLF